MGNERIDAAAAQAKGAIKEALGKVTGDARAEAEGKAEKATGTVQDAPGGNKDGVRDAVRT